jgi:uncharacterized damage-inducible protein DinB
MKPHPATPFARRIWFERKFALGLPPEAFPDILERLRGTPARLEERVSGVGRETLVRRIGEAWSIQENVGHLLDLEPLWLGRLDDFARGDDRLRPADLGNRRTHDARHNDSSIEALLAEFRRERSEIVGKAEALGPSGLEHTALHPRLGQPMTVVDHLFFVAEHDDHHLATIGELIRRFAA